MATATCPNCKCTPQTCSCGPVVSDPGTASNVLKICGDQAVPQNVGQIDVLTPTTPGAVPVVTLPCPALPGRTILVNALGSDAIVRPSGDGVSIAGASTNGDFAVREGGSVEFTATAGCKWTVLGSGGADVADYIIVGLGTAGAPLARYLSEDMSTSVIAFEAGQNLGTDPNVLASPSNPTLPGGSTSIMTADPFYAWIRSQDPANLQIGLRQIYAYSDGRMWGGSSGHNGKQAVRSSPDIYDAWASESGASRWGYNSLLPFMKFLEQYVPNGCALNTAQRGTAGKIGMSASGPAPAGDPYYTAMAAQTNSNYLPAGDYNDPTAYVANKGVVTPQQRFIHQNVPPVNGTWPQGTTASFRSWAQDYLDSSVVNADGSPVGNRKLQIVSKATVTKVVIEKVNGQLTATGVQYFLADDPNTIRFARANKKVILCAGSNATPALLQLSGVGPSALLTSLGIPVLVNNPNVGHNIQNHYGANGMLPLDATHQVTTFDGGTIFQFGDNSSPGIPGLAPAIGVNDGVRRMQMFSTGVFPISLNILQGIYGTTNGLPAGMGITGVTSLLSFYLRPNKLGSVEIVSTDPTVPPLLRGAYYKDGTGPTSDLQFIVNQFKIMANVSIAFSNRMPIFPPATHYPAAEYPGPYADARVGTAADDSFLISDALNVLLLSAYHNTGSCRMSTSAVGGVVDGNLDVFGVKNLSCCDDSIAPEITTGNTAHPAYLIGLVKAKIEGAIGLP